MLQIVTKLIIERNNPNLILHMIEKEEEEKDEEEEENCYFNLTQIHLLHVITFLLRFTFNHFHKHLHCFFRIFTFKKAHFELYAK